MDRTEKEKTVASLRSLFEETGTVVVTHYSGLNVAEMTELRGRMREVGAGFKVIKNRLTRLALEGTKFQAMTDLFVGPTAIAYSEDPVAAAKASVEFAKKNAKLVVLGGALGEKILDKAAVCGLGELPSLDGLRARLVGMISTPATRIAGVLQAPAGQLARVVGAYAEEGEAA